MASHDLRLPRTPTQSRSHSAGSGHPRTRVHACRARIIRNRAHRHRGYGVGVGASRAVIAGSSRHRRDHGAGSPVPSTRKSTVNRKHTDIRQSIGYRVDDRRPSGSIAARMLGDRALSCRDEGVSSCRFGTARRGGSGGPISDVDRASRVRLPPSPPLSRRFDSTSRALRCTC